jgi:hypothetical protein
MRHGALQHDFGGAEGSRRCSSVTFVAKRREESASSMAESPPPTTAISLSRKEEAVAGGAARHAVADQRLFAGQAQPARARARGHNQRARVISPVEVCSGWDARPLDPSHQVRLIGGAEARRLLLHVLDQLRPLDAVGPAGKVLDQRGDGELAAGLVALQNQRFHPGARGVERRRQSGAAGT